jgi:hypothetical protein
MRDFTEQILSDLTSEEGTKQLFYANMVARINIIKKLPSETYEHLMLPVAGVENNILSCMNFALRKDVENLEKTLKILDDAVGAIKEIINALFKIERED